MRLLITGTPGTGKTTIARALAKELKLKYFNEMEVSVKQNIGHWDTVENELVVPLPKLKKALEKQVKGLKNYVIEGHMVCEIKLPVDLAIVLQVHPELLEQRLEYKQYKMEKLLDNVFCEGIEYCKKHALRKYGTKKVVCVQNNNSIKETLGKILLVLGKQKLLKSF
ncbi:MAG: AAA family ATPase [Candidatus Diapherotrites archaeon]|nr:AAA family ATPase [Candidatus Diapherotrites archaeon]